MLEPSQNLVLRALKPEAMAKLGPMLQPVELELKQTISRAGRPLRQVVFPVDSIVSVVTDDEDGHVIEVGTVGREGVLGVPLVLGADKMEVTAFCQSEGPALRMGADDFRDALDRVPGLRDACQRYTQSFMTQLSQSVACNGLHTVEERCARWLLQTHDRVYGDVLDLTHEFLSQMLGVRRASVSLVAKQFQSAGLIDYHRGKIRVLDRPGLEDTACACYAIISKELRRLLGPWE